MQIKLLLHECLGVQRRHSDGNAWKKEAHLGMAPANC